MRNESNQRIILIIIIIAIVIVLFNKKRSQNKIYNNGIAITKPVISTMEIDKIKKLLIAEVEPSGNIPKNIFNNPFAKEKIKVKPITYTKKYIPKPYSLAKTIVDPAEKLMVTGIIWKNGKGSAIINGDIYYAGNTIEGFTIKNIKPNEVIVKNKNNIYSLSIQ